MILGQLRIGARQAKNAPLYITMQFIHCTLSWGGALVNYLTLSNCHTLSYIIIIFYLMVHHHTLYIVTHCTLSWGGAWVNYGKLATKLGRFSNQLPLSPSSTPHFKSLAEINLFGMISSLVFWIELSESPNLVPDSSLKPGKWKGNGRKAKWKNSTGWIETSSRWWKMMILPPKTCKCFLCASNNQDIVRMHPISSTTIEIFRKFVLKAECSHTSRIFLELILPW